MTRHEEFRVYMKAANRTSGSNGDDHLTEAQIIAYCRNEMSEAEHETAQAHLVSCEQCLTLFRNARDFLEPAGNEEEEITPAETDEAWRTLWQRVQGDAPTVVSGDFSRARGKKIFSAVPLALAASLLISLSALGWLTWRYLKERESRRQSQEIAMQLENRQRELEQRLRQLEQSGDEQLKQERDQRIALEAELNQLQAQLAQQRHQNVPVFIATLSSARGAEDDVRLRFTGASESARLKLLINKPYEYPEYAIEFADHNGKIVMRSSGLRPSGDDGALSLRINRSAFPAGKYKLRLFGGKEKNPLGEYGVSVNP